MKHLNLECIVCKSNMYSYVCCHHLLILLWTTPQKFNSSPLKSYRIPIGKDRLPTSIFQGRAVKLRGCMFFNDMHQCHLATTWLLRSVLDETAELPIILARREKPPKRRDPEMIGRWGHREDGRLNGRIVVKVG